MDTYTLEQLKQIKASLPASIYNRIKRVNSFINLDYSRYIEAIQFTKQGATKWSYSVSLEDVKFYCQTQRYIMSNI